MKPIGVEDFGKQLIETLDLDPVYVALHAARLSPGHLKRWLLAYWCFYHAGVASWLSDQDGVAYWKAMRLATENEEESPLGERWPRGRERRHWRGQRAIDAVDVMAQEAPEDLVARLYSRCTRYSQVKERVEELPMFGPWIAFKVGDMIERVIGYPIAFERAEVFLFDSPRDSAVELYEMKHGTHAIDERAAVSWSIAYLLEEFGHYDAPPNYNRKVGLQEVETILCKYKSHLSGHYPIGNDLREVRHGLEGWASHCTTAMRLIQARP